MFTVFKPSAQHLFVAVKSLDLFLGIEGPRMRGSKRPSVIMLAESLVSRKLQVRAPWSGVWSMVRAAEDRAECVCGGGARAGAGRRNTCDRGVTASQRPGSAAERPGSGGMRAPAHLGDQQQTRFVFRIPFVRFRR